MFTDWRFLFLEIYKSCHRNPSSLYARPRCPCETSPTNLDSGKLRLLPSVAILKISTFFFVKIAKMLQNLANKPSYAKELYMITLNPFVENNKARINQFLNNLCEVGDFYDTLEVRGPLNTQKKISFLHHRWTSIWPYRKRTCRLISL